MICDNYDTCRSIVFDLTTALATEERARAGGWVVWQGVNQDGREVVVVLCPKCRKVSMDPAPKPMEGEQTLF